MSKNYLHSFKIARFNIEFGQDSLFKRVRYKMKDVHVPYLDGEHFNDRLSEKNVPAVAFERIKEFDANEWTLKTAEVRTDKGKL